MDTIVDLNECLRDSPQFRTVLEKHETENDQFEKTMSEVLKQFKSMIELGKQYMHVKKNFSSSLLNLSDCFVAEEEHISRYIKRFVSQYYEVSKYGHCLNEQHQNISENLYKLLENDLGTIKELKRRFEKRSDDLDLVYNRYSQVPKAKQAEWEEAHNMLLASRSCFQHLSLDYVAQLSLFSSRRTHVILDSLLSLANSYGTYFHQGYDYFEDIKDFNNDIAASLIDMRTQSNKLEKSLNNRHHLVSQLESVPTLHRDGDSIRLEGYLFKRTSSTFKSWNRRWFIIQNHQLVYRKRSNDNEPTVMEDDLRLCNARPVHEIDRRFCFEVVSPTKSHILQADSEEACKQWLTALQAGIDAAYNSNREFVAVAQDGNAKRNSYLDASSLDSLSTNTSSSTNLSAVQVQTNSGTGGGGGGGGVSTILSQSNLVQSNMEALSDCVKILSIPGNERCADCESLEPIWASINIGITLCIECSGVHRSLGVHVSKVRSLNLDHLDCEQVNVMLALGNALVNQIYEAKYPLIIATNQSCPQSGLVVPTNEHNIESNCEFYVHTDSEHTQADNEKPLLFTDSSVATTRSKSPVTSFTLKKIDSKSCRAEREKWIRAKYVDKLFVDKSVNIDILPLEQTDEKVLHQSVSRPLDQLLENSSFREIHSAVVAQLSSSGYLQMQTSEDVDLINHYYNLMLYEAAFRRDFKVMAIALASDAKVNWSNQFSNGRTVLFQAIASDSMTVCEYLLLNGAKCNVKDDHGSTPLLEATRNSNTGQVCLLLKRGADLNSTNDASEDALSIAINTANADIVTLLRLKRLKDEMRHDELGNHNDDTFNEVLRDFSRTQIQSESTGANMRPNT